MIDSMIPDFVLNSVRSLEKMFKKVGGRRQAAKTPLGISFFAFCQ